MTSAAARRQWRTWAHLPDCDDERLDAWAAHLCTDIRLQETLRIGEEALFGPVRATNGWPTPDIDTQICESLYALLGLLAVPRVARQHEVRGIPAEAGQGACAGIGQAIAYYRRVQGADVWGVERGLLDWCRLIASGELYRLGRLEYNPRVYQGVAIALRHRSSGAVIALSGDGILYDGDGYAVTDALNPPTGTWEATFYEDEDSVTGYVIPPTGQAQRQKVSLTKPQWEIVLRPGDPVLDVHIPGGQPLDTDSSRASLLSAVEFFKQHLVVPPRAFICHSWLLDPAWENKLPTDCRIVQWARQPYRFPVASGTGDGLYFVFARHEIDPAQTPANTRLERVMRDAVANGQPLRSGGMFLLTEDAARWGQGPYRAGWADISSLLSVSEVTE